jgi:hypothetical protein
MDIHEEQQAILTVTPHHVMVMMGVFCPLQFDMTIKGIQHMALTLRVESDIYGDYKIDTTVMDTMTPTQRHILQNYFKAHKGTHITKDFLRDLVEKAA